MKPASDEATRAAARRAALDVELFAQGARALALARETRPKNTNKAYGPKQKEWQVSRPPYPPYPQGGGGGSPPLSRCPSESHASSRPTGVLRREGF